MGCRYSFRQSAKAYQSKWLCHRFTLVTRWQTSCVFVCPRRWGAGPLEAVPAQVGVIGADIRNQRLTLVSATGGSVREVSPANLNVYEYDWSAQGDRVAATAAPGPADNNWWIAKLYTLSLLSGEMKLVYTPPVERQISVPRWSPDGKTIGFIGGIMSDEGFLGGDIFAVSSAGGPARDLTPGTTASPMGSDGWQTRRFS